MRMKPFTSPRGIVALMIVAMVIVGSAAVCQVWIRLRVIDYGYKISKATREHNQLLELNRRLRLELALLKNPERITQIARNELNLQSPNPDQIKRLRRHDPNPSHSYRSQYPEARKENLFPKPSTHADYNKSKDSSASGGKNKESVHAPQIFAAMKRSPKSHSHDEIVAKRYE